MIAVTQSNMARPDKEAVVMMLRALLAGAVEGQAWGQVPRILEAERIACIPSMPVDKYL